jgi:hypothetical protein
VLSGFIIAEKKSLDPLPYPPFFQTLKWDPYRPLKISSRAKIPSAITRFPPARRRRGARLLSNVRRSRSLSAETIPPSLENPPDEGVISHLGWSA